MAVCGLLSMLCVFPFLPDMDSCPGHSSGIARKPSRFRDTATEAQASSCLSSTMVDSNDPEDSGSSQPPSTSELNHPNIRDPSSQRPELELSISSLNDPHRNIQATGHPRLRPVKEEIDPSSSSTGRDEAFGGPGGGEEESSFTGPPRKRARMSPLGFSLEESQTVIREQQQLQRHLSLSSGSDITGLHGLMPSRSLPTLRTDKEPSLSPSRGPTGGSKPGTSWWLMPKVSGSAAESQHYQSAQDAARANFGIEGRGANLGTTFHERDYLFKEPSFFPNMLSSMESEHSRRGEDAPSAVSRSSSDQGRPQSQLQDPPEHLFFSRQEASTSRVSSASSVSEETAPRSSLTFFAKNQEGASLHETSPAFAHLSPHHSFESQGARRRHSSVSEPHQQGVFDRDVQQQHPQQGAFSRQQGQDQRSLQQRPSLQGPSAGRNANTSFYARIIDAAHQPVSSPFSQAGFLGTFNPAGLSFNVPGQSSRVTSHLGVGPVQFGGEANPSLVQQQVNSEVIRNLLAANPSMTSLAPFMSQMQAPDPARLSFPNISSLDFLQSLQRQTFPQVSDRYSRPPGAQVIGVHQPQQEFTYLSAPPPSHHNLSAELNLSLPPRAQSGLQTSAGLREFLSPQGPLSAGQGRVLAVGSHGFTAAMELPTSLSLQGPNAPTPLTVVMEGRSLGRRLLQEYDGYENFAAAMRSLVESNISSLEPRAHGESCTLANAIPGYVIAYEDEEGDVLLAGDLPWRDFVRVAKQIRIVSSSKLSFKPPTGPPRS